MMQRVIMKSHHESDLNDPKKNELKLADDMLIRHGLSKRLAITEATNKGREFKWDV